MRASAALVKAFGSLRPELQSLTVDFPREVSPTLERVIRRAYLEALKIWPAAYGRLYRTSGSGRREVYTRYLGRPGVRALERLVGETGAKVLVAPHFYGGGVLGRYKQKHPSAFCAVVLTDYVPHPIGVPDNLDLYVVADERAAEMVAKLGVPEKLIHATGIPIDTAFEEPVDASDVLAGLPGPDGHEDLPAVMVMGGGLGGGALEEVTISLLDASTALRLIILCGTNDRTRIRLERLARRWNYPICCLGFTDRVRELMYASSVLVTKPGGMTCTEALACGLPQVLYRPIPGNEEDNSAAIVRYGAGVIARDTSEVLGQTLRILVSSSLRKRMVEAAQRAHRPHSALSAAKLILQGLE